MNVLSCLSSSVQCSPAKLLPNYLNPIHSPTPSWTMQPHITGLPSNAHAIPPHACPHIMGHTAPLIGLPHPFMPPHTSSHSIMHPQCLTCQCNTCCTQMHMYFYIHTAQSCGTLAHKHSINTCTHTKHEHMPVLEHAHTNPHT